MGLWLDKPLTVLVNGGSASAAEIVGGSLRDNGRATLLGETTFGTGTVLTPFAQPDGSTVLLGTALWLSADGERLWREGVEPDREVPMPLDAIPSRPTDDADLSADEWAALDDAQLKGGRRRRGRRPRPRGGRRGRAIAVLAPLRMFRAHPVPGDHAAVRSPG
jgi:carboxyl-terminal processing protease